jgi:hypothetical protein
LVEEDAYFGFHDYSRFFEGHEGAGIDNFVPELGGVLGFELVLKLVEDGFVEVGFIKMVLIEIEGVGLG